MKNKALKKHYINVNGGIYKTEEDSDEDKPVRDPIHPETKQEKKKKKEQLKVVELETERSLEELV